MCYHIFAFIAGFLLDLLIGDPHFIPHPVRLIGSLISFLDKRLNCDVRNNRSGEKTAVDANIEKIKLSKYKRGMLLAFTVIIVVFAVSALILATAYSINLYAGIIVEAVMADSCHKVSSGGEHEGVRCAKDRRSRCRKKGRFHDCWQRYICA